MHISGSTQQPHRPGPLHQSNKTHKGGRHNRKSSATSEIKAKGPPKLPDRVKRDERLNQAIQNRKLKREKTIEEKRKLGIEHRSPLLIGVLDIHMNSCLSFFKGIENGNDGTLVVKTINDHTIYVVATKLKMRFKLVSIDSSKFDEALDIMKTLDLLMLLYKPNFIETEGCDEALHLLRATHIHCKPTTIHIVDGSSESDDSNLVKKMIDAKRELRSRIKDEKVHSIEKSTDYVQLFHIVGNCKRQRSLFKDVRTMIATDKIEVIENSITFSGFVRKRILSPNDLVHIVGYGEYQIKQIDILPDIVALRPTSLEGTQVVETLKPDRMKQETLDEENDVDPMEGEQTWPTAEELAAEIEKRNTKRIIKKLPAGTSEYQGAWIPEDSDEEHDYSSANEDDDGDARMASIPEGDESESDAESDARDDDDSMSVKDDDASVMDVDDYDKKHYNEKEMKILEKVREARLDEMFPDEVDTPADTPARVRFAKYRGLKSFRTSHWDPQENLPPEYSRIFQFQNFQQTKRRVIGELPEFGADPGQYVRVHIANVPVDVITKILARQDPPALFGLLKYERKMTVMNIVIKRLPDSNLNHPIQSKDELIFYVGFRKFKARPLFTNHSVSSKFKYEKFLRDDVAMVATVFAPVTFPPAPVLVLRENYKGKKELVASGSVLDSGPSRLIIKRIRLSGHPFKIHSKSAVVRFMFFNEDDVMYFKPVELTTKYNRRGHITEPLGTHGHMKCTFDKKIRSDDCIFMNLYKRVFPKWNYTPIYT